MKFLRKWLKPDSKIQSSANESEQARTNGEQTDESSVGWIGNDQSDSSVFDTGSLRIEKNKFSEAASQRPPDLEGDSSRNGEEDTGFDPYNTGRFDSKKTK